MRLLLALAVLLAGLVASASAAPPTRHRPAKPVLSFDQYVRQLQDPERLWRLRAVEAIRDHYKSRILEALPQMIEILGDDLNRPNRDRAYLLAPTIWQTAQLAGPGRLKVIRESTCHKNPLMRAGAFNLWLMAAYDKDAGVDRDNYLAGVRRGLKDESILVRGQAVLALQAFRDWTSKYKAQPGFRDAPPKVMKEVILLLAAALDDRVSPGIKMNSPAVNAAMVLHRLRAVAKPAIPALVKAMRVKDVAEYVTGTGEALRGIAQENPEIAEDVVNILRSILTDKKRPDSLRACAAGALNKIGPAVRFAVPDLADVLEEPNISEELRDQVLNVFINTGPRAVAALSVLIKRLEQIKDRQEQRTILLIFRNMGPAAYPAAETLEKWVEKVDKYDPLLAREASKTLRAIRK